VKTIVRIDPQAVDEKLPALATKMLAEAYSVRRTDEALLIVDQGKDGKPVYITIGSHPPELVIGDRKVWGVFEPPESQEPVATFFDRVAADRWALDLTAPGTDCKVKEVDATDKTVVRVAVAVLLMRDGKVLLGKLKQAGQYALPEGRLEVGESIEAAAQRTMKRLTKLTVGRISVSKHAPYVSTFLDHVGQHFLTLVVLAEDIGGEPVVQDTELWESCGWFDADNPPEPLFITVKQIIALAKHNAKPPKQTYKVTR
jgi:8-oxo-dGTP diphosphatase